MATTETRTGFRLPWSTDRSASSGTTADPADTAPGEAAPEPEAGATTDLAAEPTTQDANGDAVHDEQEEPVTTLAPDTAPTHAHVEPAVDHGATDAAQSDPAVGERAADAYERRAAAAFAAPAKVEPPRRPTKFLADLTRAMQAAAEQARTATLEQYHADGTAVIEEIHGRSATNVVDLRRRADEDVAEIKEWSKAEIARIRQETEQRIVARREQLEGQLERHAALVEHEIERVRRQVAAFEQAMGRFFDQLLAEDDPAHFAASAANLPDPPPFSSIDEDALAALLAEPGIGTPAPEEPETAVEAESPALEAVVEPAVGEAEPEAVEADAIPETETESFDRDAALAAIQAAAEAAAASEAAEAEADLTEAEAEGAETLGEESVPAASTEGAATEEASPAEVTPPVDEAVQADTVPELDPRLAMLGLGPDFAAAAEVAAAEAAVADAEGIPEISEDALAARLGALAPEEATAVPAATATTQVVTTGLVSVASIASFKRHLGRLPGVVHVGVSSGPDGEFVFAVEHDAATSLRDVVPTIPGFGARVTNAGDGTLQVSAQDPQD